MTRDLTGDMRLFHSKTEANKEFLQLVKKMANETHNYAIVEGCFLELAEPNLLSTVEQCVKKGLTTLDVYPLFFNQGNHVARDIPKQVQRAGEAYPNCQIRLLNYFGQFDGLSQCVLGHIVQQSTQ